MFNAFVLIFSLVVCFLAYKLYLEHKLAMKRKAWANFKRPLH